MSDDNLFADCRNIIAMFTDGNVAIEPNTKIGEVVGRVLEEVDFLSVSVALEIMHHVNIPDELAENPDATFGELAEAVALLPRIQDRYYPAARAHAKQRSGGHGPEGTTGKER